MTTIRDFVLTALLVGGSLMVWAVNKKPFVVLELTDWQGLDGTMRPSGRVVADKTWSAGKLTVPFADLERQKAFLSEAPGMNMLGKMPQP